MKLGSNLTNPVALVNQLYANGAAAVVLFNRFYQPDIQIDNLTFTTANVMSSPSELSDRIRWTAIASAEFLSWIMLFQAAYTTEKALSSLCFQALLP